MNVSLTFKNSIELKTDKAELVFQFRLVYRVLALTRHMGCNTCTDSGLSCITKRAIN